MNGGSKSGLHTPLKTENETNLLKRKESNCDKNTNLSTVSKPKPSGILELQKRILDEIISKITALDGLPFRVFCTTELRKSLSVRGFKNQPTSINTIRTVINYINGVHNSLKHEKIQLKLNGEKFSLTFDEWMGEERAAF
ncbi:hypothetical protein TNCV_4210621 [Trichonephila clavipes]|nr:hypothetical protein TNCV_4210621 [Trichonephila clavipes]